MTTIHDHLGIRLLLRPSLPMFGVSYAVHDPMNQGYRTYPELARVLIPMKWRKSDA
jgi:hypothetical protein